MAKQKRDGFFWTSFADLMTSLFFIMLVLYLLTYVLLKNKERELQKTVNDLQHKLEVYELVEQNLKPLKTDTALFRYEEKYKRFTLGFNVFFENDKSRIVPGELRYFETTEPKIRDVGTQLKKTMDILVKSKMKNPALKNVSYLLIISGYASQLDFDNKEHSYYLSYSRAYNLWKYWNDIGLDFETDEYKDIIDLQIAGNGWGGIGRIERDPENGLVNEKKNQRFIIQIIPKIGKTP